MEPYEIRDDIGHLNPIRESALADFSAGSVVGELLATIVDEHINGVRVVKSFLAEQRGLDVLAPAADYFVVDNVSLGAQVLFGLVTSSPGGNGNSTTTTLYGLAPEVGYDNAVAIAKKAHRGGTTLKAAALALGHVTSEEFDKTVIPKEMTYPK